MRFSFFDPQQPAIQKVRVPNGASFQTVRFKAGIVEDFEYGWSRETTFDYAVRDVQGLQRLAGHAPAEYKQVCLRSAIVILVSGLESFIRVALHGSADLPNEDNVGRQLPRQSLAAYNQALKKVFESYEPPTGKDALVLDRLFKARHAIVHLGSRATSDVAAAIGAPRNTPLEFDSDELIRVLVAVTNFVESIERLLPPGFDVGDLDLDDSSSD